MSRDVFLNVVSDAFHLDGATPPPVRFRDVKQQASMAHSSAIGDQIADVRAIRATSSSHEVAIASGSYFIRAKLHFSCGDGRPVSADKTAPRGYYVLGLGAWCT